MSVAPGARAAGPSVRLVPGAPALNLGNYDLGKLGYRVDECFLTGVARSYQPLAPFAEDGVWPAAPDASAPFTTRLVAVRPLGAATFNGAVMVEWLNVSGGADAGADWLMTHRELLRGGFAYVGVSAQKVGIDGGRSSLGPGSHALKAADPARYGELTHPGDDFSFDIFSQAGRAVRDLGVLGGLRPRRLLAAGESQSSLFLTTYVNAIDPLARVYDGFLIHSRGALAPALQGNFYGDAQKAMPPAVKIRPDVRAPVMMVLTELDVTNFLAARQPDGERIRTWEIPGAAHADVYMLAVSRMDSGQADIPALAAAWAPTRDTSGGKLTLPMNAAPQHHYVLSAAVKALDTWVEHGRTPAHGPLIDVQPGPPGGTPDFLGRGAAAVVARDADGNAVGGIRTPWIDVPTATLSGQGNSGAPLARLVGSTVAFDPTRLARLYPGGKADYLGRFRAALDRSIAAGFILAADRAEILALAAAMYPS